MNDYGVIDMSGGLLSIPGLVFYILGTATLVAGSVWLVNTNVPKRYRKLNYIYCGLSTIAISTWLNIGLGLWFYVR
jgi:hypothetical protein